MPNSSPIDHVEDIFSDTPIAGPDPVQLVTEDAPMTSSEPNEVRVGGRRRWLVIATSVLALLLLSGAALAGWLWLQARPQSAPTTISSDTNTTIPTITNANAVVNVNEVPANTNTNVGNTPSFVDVDHDGLSDEEEIIENTNPKKKDTDEDGLSDREEVRVYDTDPRNPDTDGDGYADGVEVTNFYHPNHPDPKKRLFDLPQ